MDEIDIAFAIIYFVTAILFYCGWRLGIFNRTQITKVMPIPPYNSTNNTDLEKTK